MTPCLSISRGSAADADAPIEVTISESRVLGKPGPRDRSVASSVIPRTQLEAPGLRAGDVLRTQPGVAVSETGGLGAPTFAFVRGASAADTSVHLAGIRLNDDVAGTADLSSIPLWLIDHVEIYRGNAPIDVDRMGPGGAIFFEPKRPTRAMGGVGYQGGSWGTSRAWAYRGSRHAGASYLVGISAERATNRYPFANDQGMLLAARERQLTVRQNADYGAVDVWSLGRAELGRGFVVRAVANLARREGGVPRLAVLQSERARRASARELVALELRGPLDTSRALHIEGRVAMLRQQEEYDDPLRELALRTDALSLVDFRLEQGLGLRYEPSTALRLRTTLSTTEEGIRRRPVDVPIDRARRESLRWASGVEIHPTSSWSLRGLAVLECHYVDLAEQPTCNGPLPTGRVGSDIAWKALRFYANAGHYLRIPTLGELHGVSGTVHGNPGLRSETGYTIDVGLRASTELDRVLRSFYFDAFAYARWADELINYTRTGEGFVRPINVDRARIEGIEVLLGSQCRRLCRFELSATGLAPLDVSAKRKTVNAILPYRSRLVVAPRMRVDWQRNRRDGLSGAGGQLSAMYQSSRFADPAGLAVIDQQFTVDLDAYVAWFDGLLTLRGRVADLFDAKRMDVVGYPLPGRSFYLGLEARR